MRGWEGHNQGAPVWEGAIVQRVRGNQSMEAQLPSLQHPSSLVLNCFLYGLLRLLPTSPTKQYLSVIKLGRVPFRDCSAALLTH